LRSIPSVQRAAQRAVHRHEYRNDLHGCAREPNGRAPQPNLESSVQRLNPELADATLWKDYHAFAIGFRCTRGTSR
jgi:hypothetical protein